mgnify:CR=1 FL=1
MERRRERLEKKARAGEAVKEMPFLLGLIEQLGKGEWIGLRTFSPEEQVWLLQARPMTALPPAPIKLNATQRRLGSILLDNVPVRPYPIDMSSWVPYGPVGMIATVIGSSAAPPSKAPRPRTCWR